MLLEGLIIRLTGRNHKDKGEELPFFHRLPIPKRPCAYTQTTVRLYPNDCAPIPGLKHIKNIISAGQNRSTDILDYKDYQPYRLIYICILCFDHMMILETNVNNAHQRKHHHGLHGRGCDKQTIHLFHNACKYSKNLLNPQTNDTDSLGEY